MAVTAKMNALLQKVKSNLILQHNEDDELLLSCIAAALNYAESYQKHKYGRGKLPPSTEQAVVMLSSHFYESRDGSTAGFFADNVTAASQVWQTIHRLLSMEKRWQI